MKKIENMDQKMEISSKKPNNFIKKNIEVGVQKSALRQVTPCK